MRRDYISIVLPVSLSGARATGGRQRLRLVIESIVSQTIFPTHCQVIVIDDGSEHGIRRLLQPLNKAGCGLVFLRNERACGLACAYNQGIGAADGDIIFLALDDFLLETNCLETHLRAHHTGGVGAYVSGIDYSYVYSAFYNRGAPGESWELDDYSLSFFRSIGVSDPIRAFQYLGMVDWSLTSRDVRERFDLLLDRSVMTVPFVDIYQEVQRPESDMHWLCVRFGNHSLSRALCKEIGGIRGYSISGHNADQDLGLKLRSAGVRIHLEKDAVAVELWHRRGSDKMGWISLARLAQAWPIPEVIALPYYFRMGFFASIDGYRRILRERRNGGRE